MLRAAKKIKHQRHSHLSPVSSHLQTSRIPSQHSHGATEIFGNQIKTTSIAQFALLKSCFTTWGDGVLAHQSETTRK